MGSLFSKKSSWMQCRQCNNNNVKIYERVCRFCVASAKQLEPPADGADKPLFGEYLCRTCSTGWTSRLCWPCHYQACKRCQQHVYPYNWRELTAADLSVTVKDHLREHCQKCLEVGYFCGDYAKLYGKI